MADAMAGEESAEPSRFGAQRQCLQLGLSRTLCQNGIVLTKRTPQSMAAQDLVRERKGSMPANLLPNAVGRQTAFETLAKQFALPAQRLGRGRQVRRGGGEAQRGKVMSGFQTLSPRENPAGSGLPLGCLCRCATRRARRERRRHPYELPSTACRSSRGATASIVPPWPAPSIAATI